MKNSPLHFDFFKIMQVTYVSFAFVVQLANPALTGSLLCFLSKFRDTDVMPKMLNDAIRYWQQTTVQNSQIDSSCLLKIFFTLFCFFSKFRDTDTMLKMLRYLALLTTDYRTVHCTAREIALVFKKKSFQVVCSVFFTNLETLHCHNAKNDAGRLYWQPTTINRTVQPER